MADKLLTVQSAGIPYYLEIQWDGRIIEDHYTLDNFPFGLILHGWMGDRWNSTIIDSTPATRDLLFGVIPIIKYAVFRANGNGGNYDNRYLLPQNVRIAEHSAYKVEFHETSYSNDFTYINIADNSRGYFVLDPSSNKPIRIKTGDTG